jgi:hypothetical protein
VNWEAIILILTGIAAFITQNINFIRDDRAANHTTEDRRLKKYWHAAGGFQHIWMMYMVGRLCGWHWAPVAGAFTWYFMDGCINSYVLNREWWFIGDTAWLDMAQRWAAGALRIDPRTFSACLKHAAIILSILYLIPKLL